MRNQTKSRQGHRYRKAATGGLTALLAVLVAVIQADSLPAWMRVTAGVLGLLTGVAGVALYWPAIRAWFPNGEEM